MYNKYFENIDRRFNTFFGNFRINIYFIYNLFLKYGS